MELTSLPKDALREILIKLKISDLFQICQTSLKIKSICQNNYFWEQKIVSDDFLIYGIERIPNESAKEYYLRIYSMSDGEKISALYSKKFKQMINKLKENNNIFKYTPLPGEM